jgi:hypothetical protein
MQLSYCLRWDMIRQTEMDMGTRGDAPLRFETGPVNLGYS